MHHETEQEQRMFGTQDVSQDAIRCSEGGGVKRLETLIDLKFLNSSFSNSNFSIRAFRAYPLIEIRQTVPCRAIRGSNISVSTALPPLANGTGICQTVAIYIIYR